MYVVDGCNKDCCDSTEVKQPNIDNSIIIRTKLWNLIKFFVCFKWLAEKGPDGAREDENEKYVG